VPTICLTTHAMNSPGLTQIVGTATASQSIWYHVSFDAYYE
jgi:hypothetical protein